MQSFLKIVNILQLFVYNSLIKLVSLKHILPLVTKGQECTVSKLQPFPLGNSEWNTLYKIQLIFWC